MKHIKMILVIQFLCLFTLSFASAPHLIQAPAELVSWSNQWNWAEQQIVSQKQDSWIGYMIEADDSMSIHRHDCDMANQTTMQALLAEAGMVVSHAFDHKIIILCCMNSDKQIIDFVVTQYDSPFKHRDMPIFWLGKTSQEASLATLKVKYNQTRDTDTREEFIFIIALHTQSSESRRFLKSCIQSDSDETIRKTAVFWLGTFSQEKLNFFIQLAEHDQSDQVKEAAIFAISRSDQADAFDALLNIAKNNSDMKMRKQAIFWLSQRENNQAGDVLHQMAFDQTTVELQEHAVFALSQWRGNHGVDDLIDIAETHPNSQVRKKAIFWLGQTDDPQALDALVGVIEKYGKRK